MARSEVTGWQGSRETTNQCPPGVNNGHRGSLKECLLYHRKRTSKEACSTSALCQKRTFCHLFDHAVGAFGIVAPAAQSSGSR